MAKLCLLGGGPAYWSVDSADQPAHFNYVATATDFFWPSGSTGKPDAVLTMHKVSYLKNFSSINMISFQLTLAREGTFGWKFLQKKS